VWAKIGSAGEEAGSTPEAARDTPDTAVQASNGTTDATAEPTNRAADRPAETAATDAHHAMARHADADTAGRGLADTRNQRRRSNARTKNLFE
jgi:hypothetical protein